MIERYSRKEMKELWTEKSRYQFWLKVEWEVCRELAAQKLIPQKQWRELNQNLESLYEKGGVDPNQVAHHEKTLRHDIIAFTTTVAESVGPTARYIHFGLTSSDVIDTALALQIKKSGEMILEGIEALLVSLKKRALEFQSLPTIGRSHGIFAEPTAFGLKFLGFYTEWVRNKNRLQEALERVAFGKLSGAVGVNSHFTPMEEEKVLKKLGLKREPVSTQVIPRDRHAEIFTVISLCAGALERISVELRHLQRSEVGEVMEGFRKGQKGSSAMPHKRNPISSENLTGCARLLRSYVSAALENIPLWHERDISHSSVERIHFPDAFILLDYALHRMKDVIDHLVVNKDRVKKNLTQAGTAVFSGHLLLALVKAGAQREEAYYWIQECALKSFEEGSDFRELAVKHEQIASHLTASQIKKLGSLEYQLKNVKKIYTEAFKQK